MEEDPGGVAATPRGGRSAHGPRRYVPALIGIALAVSGGVAGGLIVWATSSDNDNAANGTKAGDTLRVKYERRGSSHTTVVTLTR